MRKYTDELLNQMRLQQDPFADAVVQHLFEHNFNFLASEDYANYQWNSQNIPLSFPAPLKQYFTEVRTCVSYPGDQVIKKGTSFFEEYASGILASLGFLSLPYCYAAADGAQVLYASERIRKNPGNRLLETAAYVFDVCAKDAFLSEGKAYVSIAKVRLMHAAIRYHLLQKDWNSAYGAPINQEDMAGTNLAFSLIATRGLRKLGFLPSSEECMDYIRLWNYIGALGGVATDLLPETIQEARGLDKKIAERNFRSSAHGAALAKALCHYMDEENTVLPKNLAAESIMAYMLGEEIAAMLSLKENRLLEKLMSPIKNIQSLQSIIVNSGQENYQKALRLYQQQAKGRKLRPYRLVDNLKD